jgi:uroporphyrin-3 C-methyltransferase
MGSQYPRGKMVTDKTTTANADDKNKSSPKPNKSTSEAAPSAESQKSSAKPSANKSPGKNAKNSPNSSLNSNLATKSAKSIPWVKTLLALLFVAGLGLAGRIGWTEWQTQLQSQAEVSEKLQADMAAIVSSFQQQQELSRQTDEKQLRLARQLDDQLSSVNLRLNSQGERILQLGTASRGDWLLSEAAYLIRLANQRLEVERSIENPLAILQNVDNIFVQLDDPELLPVRKALAKDMAALRMTNKVDREGIFLELQATSDALKNLPIHEPVNLTKIPSLTDSETANKEELSLLENFERFSQKLGQLIVVQKRQQPIEPLLTAGEHAIIQSNIYLLLEQAQSALLREEQIIYTASLKKTVALLVRYFQLNSQSEALVERLNILSERSVIQRLPDISGSIAAVQTMLNLRQSRISDGEQQK